MPSTARRFPTCRLLQPRLGSVEEWRFVNNNNDEHPMHIHVNDFQVTHTFDPSTGRRDGPGTVVRRQCQRAGADLGRGKAVIQAGTLSLRMSFDDFTGLFVMHCHRLNHEDNGLMTLVNVIPAVSTYAVAVPGIARASRPRSKSTTATATSSSPRSIPFPGFDGNAERRHGRHR